MRPKYGEYSSADAQIRRDTATPKFTPQKTPHNPAALKYHNTA
jgi:hypothetical protein